MEPASGSGVQLPVGVEIVKQQLHVTIFGAHLGEAKQENPAITNSSVFTSAPSISLTPISKWWVAKLPITKAHISAKTNIGSF